MLLCALAVATGHAQNRGTIVDARDGQKYQWTKIDGVVWMAENLNYAMDSSYCYDDNPVYCEKYGRLYTWAAAMKACPTGWHLPTSKEWDELRKSIGEKVGAKLKSKEWDGTDDFGFHALPAGGRNYDGHFYGIETNANFWTATEENDYDADARWLESDDTRLDSDGSGNKDYAFSVRCVKD